MSDMSPSQMDQRLKELAGKMLTNTMTTAEASEQYFLTIDRRNSIFNPSSDAKFEQLLKHPRRI